MTLIMRLEGLASGEPSPVDGHFLKDYDPDRDGDTGTICHFLTTTNPDEAMRFTDILELRSTWISISKHRPVRPDGNPNRPLTAFSISVETVE